MRGQFLNFLVVPLGAFICWMAKGFKGSFDDFYSDGRYAKNMGVGMIFLFLCIGITAFIYKF